MPNHQQCSRPVGCLFTMSNNVCPPTPRLHLVQPLPVNTSRSICNLSYKLCVSVYCILSFTVINALSPELNPICYLLALLAHDFLHISRIRVKSLNLSLLMSYIHMEHLFLMFVDHTQGCSTVGRTPLDELITRPEESYRPCCIVVCDLQTSRIGAPYIYMTLVA
jgi:hypothetical protein